MGGFVGCAPASLVIVALMARHHAAARGRFARMADTRTGNVRGAERRPVALKKVNDYRHD
jgi:hypothetical protein